MEQALAKQLLTDEFISKYSDFPEHMTELGKFVFYRTYSRWLTEQRRRETWKETCRRAVEYNVGLVESTTVEEAQKLFDNMFNLRQFLSGRTLWVGGTPIASKYPMSNYNCAFTVIDEVESFRDLFYLLMIGTGVGFRALKADVEKLPPFRQGVKLIHKPYKGKKKNKRAEHSSLIVKGKRNATIIVGDSKEGWVEALDIYFKVLTDPMYRGIETVQISYDSVRPKGERLETFGGTASGYESLKTMYEKIDLVLNSDKYAPRPVKGKLRPIQVLDICNIIGENVVVGGVRRTAEIGLLDANDDESITAKKDLWKYPDKFHRFMSNNSVFYEEKPTRERLAWQFQVLRNEGEPCFVNAEVARRRRPNFQGVNPCAEILLDNRGLCNLTTVNLMQFVSNGCLNMKELEEAQRMSARAGLRMTTVTLELPRWDIVQKRDRLLGCSVTGWKDAIEALGWTKEQEEILEQHLHDIARAEADRYADELGVPRPLLVTAVKPEGTLSQVAGGVSSGLHHAHSEYYARRIRINAHDPLCKAVEFLGWQVDNEVGQGIEVDGKITPVNTKVITFPVYSPVKRTKYEVSAIEQLETYYSFQDHYTEHNSSNTITVKDDEWDAVEQNIWDNWDNMLAVSFLKLDGHTYDLAPYEAITKEQYDKLVDDMVQFFPDVLNMFEDKGEDFDISDNECSTGVCPVR